MSNTTPLSGLQELLVEFMSSKWTTENLFISEKHLSFNITSPHPSLLLLTTYHYLVIVMSFMSFDVLQLWCYRNSSEVNECCDMLIPVLMFVTMSHGYVCCLLIELAILVQSTVPESIAWEVLYVHLLIGVALQPKCLSHKSMELQLMDVSDYIMWPSKHTLSTKVFELGNHSHYYLWTGAPTNMKSLACVVVEIQPIPMHQPHLSFQRTQWNTLVSLQVDFPYTQYLSVCAHCKNKTVGYPGCKIWRSSLYCL